MKKISIIVILSLASALSTVLALPACNPTTGPITLNPDSTQMVYDFDSDSTPIRGGDYADNPVRPFLVGSLSHATVMWFASNSKGYCQTIGVPVNQGISDILAKMQRVVDPATGECVRWLQSRFNTPQGLNYSVQSYNNELWMVVPYTLDGTTVYALVHNEYHLTPRNTSDVYGNLVAAISTDGAKTFTLIQDNAGNNKPVIVSPYPYNAPLQQGKGGMFAQTNIIKWGQYYYMFVDQYLVHLAANGPPQGVCLYRTDTISDFSSWRAWDAKTNQYDIVPPTHYPNSFTAAIPSLCSPIPGLPPYFHFSWTYNTVLKAFILVGFDPHYQGQQGAFVYTLANLDSKTGQLRPIAGNSTIFPTYFLRYVGNFQAWRQGEDTYQAYPSILDPTSPQLNPGDRNFQYSGAHPYLYFTQSNPITAQNPHGQDRDIVRQALTVHACQLQ